MGRFDGILLMSDFDGTLSVRAGEVSRENCEAIEYFEREGGRFCVASGRDMSYVANITDRLNIKGYCISLNGTVIFDPVKREAVHKIPFDSDAMIGFIKKLAKECPDCDHMRLHTEKEHHNFKVTEDFEAGIRAINEPFYKFVWDTPAELSDKYFARIRELAENDFYISRSWVNILEILPAGASKGDAIGYLKKLYGGRIHTVIAVGDYENDIDMIKKADIGYAVANAVPELAAVADRHTVDCREHAIAAIINEL